MRRLLIIVLLMLLAGVGVIALIETDPGYVLVSYGHTTVETSLWVGLVLLLLGFGLVYILLRGVGGVLATRGIVSDWMSRRAYSRLLARCQMKLDAGEAQWVVDALLEQRPLLAQELRLLARARDQLGEWRDVIALLPKLRKQKVFGESELAAYARRAHLGLLADSDTTALQAVWAEFPVEQRNDPRLVQDYATRLLENGAGGEAEKVLARAIKRSWDTGLVSLFGRIEGDDPARRLKLAQRWEKKHADDTSLMLCLGRLSLQNELWGKARAYFEKCHAFSPNAEACAELARLLFSLGEREQSAQFYREGLLLSQPNLPDLPQTRREVKQIA
ncbi:MAG: heme biosynthesis HemY N-terminal domain-containing protein [Halieaceae bacterium]|jgi:HemY protein|nr:heme biosynthesis HemY N-terminal domain-containing protein [Halieaceae bacterium]